MSKFWQTTFSPEFCAKATGTLKMLDRIPLDGNTLAFPGKSSERLWSDALTLQEEWDENFRPVTLEKEKKRKEFPALILAFVKDGLAEIANHSPKFSEDPDTAIKLLADLERGSKKLLEFKHSFFRNYQETELAQLAKFLEETAKERQEIIRRAKAEASLLLQCHTKFESAFSQQFLEDAARLEKVTLPAYRNDILARRKTRSFTYQDDKWLEELHQASQPLARMINSSYTFPNHIMLRNFIKFENVAAVLKKADIHEVQQFVDVHREELNLAKKSAEENLAQELQKVRFAAAR